MQSQAFFGADSAVHAQLMKHFDRQAVTVHAAVNEEQGPANPAVNAMQRLRALPEVQVRPTNFGPSIHGAGRADRLRRVIGGAAMLPSLASLASYIKTNDIRIVHGTEKPRDALYGVLLGKLT